MWLVSRVWYTAFLVFTLSGCTGAISGIVGSTLTRTTYPRVSIAANAPLALQGHGRQWVSFPTEYLSLDATGIMDWAVYAETDEGPVTRHAHAFIARPNDERSWVFQPESYKAPGGLALGRQEINGHVWNVQVIRVAAQGDWFSSMWTGNGRQVPDYWIARRFSSTPERITRVVAEYRESWPECLDPDVKDLIFVRKECIEGFIARSDAAFTLTMHAVDPALGAPVPSVLVKPQFTPNMEKLAGELVRRNTGFGFGR